MEMYLAQTKEREMEEARRLYGMATKRCCRSTAFTVVDHIIYFTRTLCIN